MYPKLLKTCCSLIVLHLSIGNAAAQFVWLDANGTKQYSDRPPPSSVPKSRIMKNPGLELRQSITNSNAPATSPAASAVLAGEESTTSPSTAKTPKLPTTTAEKNVEFTKRQMDQAEKDRKAADDAKEAAIKAKNCERVQAYARSLQSGERIATLDKNGEKNYLSDEKRAQETSDAMGALNGCK